MHKNNPVRCQRFDTSLFCRYYEQLSRCSGLTQMAQYPQHGNTSRLLHSVAVAYYSYRLAAATPASFHMHEMVRGALFHDYFFYDAQDGDPAHKGHWTRHPSIALENAQKELRLTGIERVSLMDKACSVYEFFRRKDPYRTLRALLEDLPVHPVLQPQAPEAL